MQNAGRRVGRTTNNTERHRQAGPSFAAPAFCMSMIKDIADSSAGRKIPKMCSGGHEKENSEVPFGFDTGDFLKRPDGVAPSAQFWRNFFSRSARLDMRTVCGRRCRFPGHKGYRCPFRGRLCAGNVHEMHLTACEALSTSSCGPQFVDGMATLHPRGCKLQRVAPNAIRISRKAEDSPRRVTILEARLASQVRGHFAEP